MPRIRCHYLDCALLDDGYCSAAQVEFDQDSGCLTYSPNADVSTDEDWDEEEEELEEWDEMDSEDDDDEDLWMDDDDDEY
jgi:hypothetical protein